MKDTIFISHSNPQDNDFARWLSLKLINMGYKVWADVLQLRGGNYTWGVIEAEIRKSTNKFIFITSRISNIADGCLNELSVADSVRREHGYQDFIIPLKIDEIPFGEMNIHINKLFAIDFTKSWAEGLKNLLEKLIEDKVPLSPDCNSDLVTNWWETVFIGENKVLLKQDEYLSNWFPIKEYPEYIHFHKFARYIGANTDIKSLKYPAITYSNYLATFAYCYDFMDELPRSEYYNPNDTLNIRVKDIIDDSLTSNFIQQKEARSILTQLTKNAWEKKLISLGLIRYELANNKNCYALKNNFNDSNRIGRIKLVGKHRERNWHYAISSFIKYYPEFSLAIKAHILFSDSDEGFISNKRIQHNLRRRLGKNWWNFHWREKLSAMMEYVSGEGEHGIRLEVGSEENIMLSKEPVLFSSNYSYIDPTKEVIDDNIESDDLRGDLNRRR